MDTSSSPQMMGIMLSLASVFIEGFLKVKQNHPFYYKMFVGFTCLGVTISLLSFVVPYSIMIRVISAALIIGSCFAVGVSWHLFYRGHRAARFFVLAWSVLLVSGLGLLLNVVVFKSASFFIENITQFACTGNRLSPLKRIHPIEKGIAAAIV